MNKYPDSLLAKVLVMESDLIEEGEFITKVAVWLKILNIKR
jgi:hypothetical protein